MHVLAGLPLADVAALLPGLFAAFVGAALFGAGFWAARRRRPDGLAALEEDVERLARGEFGDVAAEIPRDERLAPLADKLGDAARALAARFGRRGLRVALLAEASSGGDGAGAIVFDQDMMVAAASRGAARLLGTSEGELEGRSAADVLAPESFRDLASLAAERRRGRAPFTADLSFVGASGEVPATAQATWLPGAEGRLALHLSVHADMRIDEVPQIKLERYWAILSYLPDGVLVVSDGRIVEANPQARNWFGETVDMIGLADLVAPEELPVVIDACARAAAGEILDAITCRLAPSGSGLAPMEAELLAAPVWFENRRAAALIVRDLGEERRYALLARVAEARLAAVLDAVGDAVLLLAAPAYADAAWRVAAVNRQLLQGLELDPAGLHGAPAAHVRAAAAKLFKDPAAFEALCAQAEAAPESGHVGTLELAGMRGGSVDVAFAPVRGGRGELLGRVVVARGAAQIMDVDNELEQDAAKISRARASLAQAREAAERLENDLAAKGAQLDHARTELADLERSRARLLGDVAHELQSPLVSIRGYSQLVLEGRLGKVSEERRRVVDAALRSIDRVLKMVGDVVEMARPAADGPLDVRPDDPRRALAESVERFSGEARRRRIQVETRIGEVGGDVPAEPGALRTVFDNLLSNAVKFTRDGGRIVATLQSGPEGTFVFEVADNGIGIPADEVPRIWERYYRGRGAVGTPGSGVGLATVRRVVTRHGGAADVESVLGRGTSFRVVWPREPAGAAASAEGESGAPAATPGVEERDAETRASA
ncbi:MAG: ATP-binding protein [Candidatus Polarisedimenticolia bacterium]